MILTDLIKFKDSVQEAVFYAEHIRLFVRQWKKNKRNFSFRLEKLSKKTLTKWKSSLTNLKLKLDLRIF